MIRHGILVVADDDAVVQGVVKASDFSYAVLTPDPADLDKFYNVELKEQLLAAQRQDFQHWIAIQSPKEVVHAVWAERLNTLLDDNKKICYDNHEIIHLAPNCRIVTIASSCETMSPAFISRNGIVYAKK